jgi:acetyl-CoA carboxylase biotin carboxyl carrier protein
VGNGLFKIRNFRWQTKGGLMDLKEIRLLIKIVENSKISELEIEEEGKKIRISKYKSNSNDAMLIGNPQMLTYHSLPPEDRAIKEQKLQEKEITESANYYEVRALMVGTFYRAPSPDAEPYVQVGQRVEIGQTLCIIEAMKLMNEIQTESAGVIVKIFVENAQPVEYNQVLFHIKK